MMEPSERARMMAEIEVMFEEYKQAHAAAEAWFAAWKARNSGFRCRRRGEQRDGA